MTEYIQIRERFLEARVYLRLAAALGDAGYTELGGRNLVGVAFDEARQDFEAAQSDEIRDAISLARVPAPRPAPASGAGQEA